MWCGSLWCVERVFTSLARNWRGKGSALSSKIINKNKNICIIFTVVDKVTRPLKLNAGQIIKKTPPSKMRVPEVICTFSCRSCALVVKLCYFQIACGTVYNLTAVWSLVIKGMMSISCHWNIISYGPLHKMIKPLFVVMVTGSLLRTWVSLPHFQSPPPCKILQELHKRLVCGNISMADELNSTDVKSS